MQDAYRACDADWELQPYPDAVAAAVQPLLDGYEHMLYLHGGNGSGKTWLAVAVLLHLRATGRGGNCKWGSVAAMDMLAAAARDMQGGRERLAWWAESTVLLLDDLGAARGTPAGNEAVEFIVARRYRARKIIIGTSNVPLSAIDAMGMARTASRFQDGIVLDMGNHDLRGRTP